MKTVHHALHLQHHRHTGRVLAHKHTSYRGLALVLGLAAATIIGLNVMNRVTADSLTLYVYARNPAPIPTDPAIITDPPDGFTTHTAPLTVSGTCPVITPSVSVAIVDNGVIAGSAPCDSDNDFSVDITLTPGENTLIARTFTITGDSGPDSTPVHVTYIAPKPPSTGATSPTGSAPSGGVGTAASGVPPLEFSVDEPFIVFGPQKDAVWTGSITGGKAPYRVRIDWGDGTVRTYTEKTAGEKRFSHHYRAMQSHIIYIQLTDQSGQHVSKQYAAVTPYIPPVVGSAFTPPTGRFGGSELLGLYGMYLLLLAGFGALWVRAHPFAYATVPISPNHRGAASRRKRAARGNR